MAASQIQWVVLGVGLTLLAVGLAIRFGKWKAGIGKKATMIHGYIPLGLMLILYALDDAALAWLGPNVILYQAVTILVFFVGIWWSFRPPHFIIPDWIHWVETHPKKVVNEMVKAVQDGQEWKTKVISAESVDAWAHTVKAKMPRKP